MKYSVRRLYKEFEALDQQEITLFGWVRNNRAQKEFGFINLNDGTFFETIQVVYESEFIENFKDVQKFRVGSAVKVKGILVCTPDRKQPFEIKARDVLLVGDSLEDYPIQPKRHTREFLRENAHLRPRTNLFSAVFRVRSILTYAIHTFFQERNFVNVVAPLITASDAEGAGETFKVTTLDLDSLPKNDEGEIDYKKDYLFTEDGPLYPFGYGLSYADFEYSGLIIDPKLETYVKHNKNWFFIILLTNIFSIRNPLAGKRN